MKKIQGCFKWIKNYTANSLRWLKKKRIYGIKRLRENARRIQLTQACARVKGTASSLWALIRKNHEAVRYYGVLLVVLGAIAVSAYGYKNGRNMPEAGAVEPLPTQEAALAAQSIADEPEEEILDGQSFQWPVEGEIIGGFAGDSLEWNELLGQWQTHPAIDIAAGAGEAVVAIADGVISEVYFDNLYGNTVVIDHGDGRMARYASLNTLQMVEVGQSVLAGDIIGSAGSCDAEETLGDHLHIEFFENGQAVDLSIYLSD